MQRADEKKEPATYERIVFKNGSGYRYMKTSLHLENVSSRPNAVQLKQLIIRGLQDLYGEVGAALPFDLLKYDEQTLTAILRVRDRSLVKLWSAMTLLGTYQNQPCAFRVSQVSHFLLALSANSREFELD
ncbi:ribonuclease P protein subunit p14 [Aplochiton taeniatus]